MFGREGIWSCGRFRLPLERPLVMGILNVTPDSFSDGGRFRTFADAIVAGLAMVEAGVDIIDVGGESTRPGAPPVGPAEEEARVIRVVTALAEDGRVPVSIDTRNASVAGACLKEGAAIVNDVSGFRDPQMVEVVTGTEAGCVVMHMLGDPKTMQREPRYRDVVGEVGAYLRETAERLEGAGVGRERIAVDPGLGFGKTTAHNLELLHRLPELVALPWPVLVGGSRKRFIGEVLGQDVPAQRLEGSLAVAAHAVLHGAACVRVHDVAETVRLVRLITAIERRG